MSEVPGRCVLVAEDDPDVLHLVCSALQGAGYRTVATGGAREAEALLGRDDLDLLVTDVGLGSASGVALAGRARELWPDLPVLFVSGRPDLDHGIGGPVAVLGKPFSLSSLVEGVEHLTAGRPTGAGAPSPARPLGDPHGSSRAFATGAGGIAPGVGAELVERLLDARDEELAAIAGDLHDDHLQKLAAVTLRLGLMRRSGWVTPEGDAEVAELEQVLLSAADRIRTQILDLSPSWLQDATLGSSLESLTARHPDVGIRPVDDADGFHGLRIGRHGHRILAALIAELAAWSLDAPVDVAADADSDAGVAGATVRVTALGSPPAGPRPPLRAEELADLSDVAVEVADLDLEELAGAGRGHRRRRWTLHLG